MKTPPNLLERLRYNALFENISDVEFNAVREKLIERRYSPNEVIADENSVYDRLILIAEGRVKIVKTTKRGDELLLALLHHGDFLGELELIDGRPRTSRVIAAEDCITFDLPKSSFEQLLRENHPFATRLLEVLSVRLRALNQHFVQEMDRSSEQSVWELNKLQQLIEAAKTVNSTLNLDDLLHVIVETALQIVDGHHGTLYIVDESKRELWSKVLKGLELVEIRLPVGKGIAGYVAATGDILNIPDAYMDPRFNPEIDEKTGYLTKTILCAPIHNKDQLIIGVLQLINKSKGTFTQDDVQFVEALSVHAAIAIENARLYEQERQKIAMEKDMLAAREVQMSLLPKESPNVPGYDIAGTSIPAHIVGGDYFDFIPVDQSHMAICLGDVSGKGLQGSLLMVSLQATLRSQTTLISVPKTFLQRSNKLLWQTTAPEKFATLVLGILDFEKHDFTYSNAGHDYPLVLSRNREPVRLKTGGIPLGILEEVQFDQETIPLAVDDLLVMYSDGVSETLNRGSGELNDEVLAALITEHRNLSAKELIAKILEIVTLRSGDYVHVDDLTLVVVKRVKG